MLTENNYQPGTLDPKKASFKNEMKKKKTPKQIKMKFFKCRTKKLDDNNIEDE